MSVAAQSWTLANSRSKAKQSLLLPFYRARNSLRPDFEQAVLDIVNPKRHAFLKPGATACSFFQEMEAAGAIYVILRWFESLPHLDPRHDLDILIDEDSFEAVASCLSQWPIGHPVDLYCSRGLAVDRTGRWSNSDPTLRCPFPADKAAAMLEGRRRFRDLCYVPETCSHFFALAAHVAFAKSADVLEDQAAGRSSRHWDHDYAGKLRELAAQCAIPLPERLSRHDLRRIAADFGWAPNGNLVDAALQ